MVCAYLCKPGTKSLRKTCSRKKYLTFGLILKKCVGGEETSAFASRLDDQNEFQLLKPNLTKNKMSFMAF